jgi:hypothetical protein
LKTEKPTKEKTLYVACFSASVVVVNSKVVGFATRVFNLKVNDRTCETDKASKVFFAEAFKIASIPWQRMQKIMAVSFLFFSGKKKVFFLFCIGAVHHSKRHFLFYSTFNMN